MAISRPVGPVTQERIEGKRLAVGVAFAGPLSSQQRVTMSATVMPPSVL